MGRANARVCTFCPWTWLGSAIPYGHRRARTKPSRCGCSWPILWNAIISAHFSDRAVACILVGMLPSSEAATVREAGLVLEADRESAVVLAEVLRGLAGAIEGAVAEVASRS